MPRVLSLAEDGTVRVEPAEELQALRGAHREEGPVEVAADAEVALENIGGGCAEMAFEIDPGGAAGAGVKVFCAPDGTEETGIWYDAAAKLLKIDMAKSTLRKDVRYGNGPLDGYGKNEENLRTTVDAPFELRPGEALNLRVFIDGPMLEVFANGRQCVTQLIYPASKESVGVKAAAKGGKVVVKRAKMWEMKAASFSDKRL
jgi:sucrose-6-phosphate hydrolase SacC (GH32 family)